MVLGASLETPATEAIAYTVQNRTSTALSVSIDFTRIRIENQPVITSDTVVTASFALIANQLNPVLGSPWSSVNGEKGALDAESTDLGIIAKRLAALIEDLLAPIPASGWPDPTNGEAGALDAESTTLGIVAKRLAALIQALKDAGFLTD